jgi:putative spermidine/putrescine transport system permease protein
MESRGVRILLRFGTFVTLSFLYLPLIVVVVFAFNKSVAQAWPPTGFTTKWFGLALREGPMRHALLLSVQIGLAATAVALILGSAAAFAVHRFRFFGREAISFALVLPIALPGIVTAMALRTAINTSGLSFGFLTIVVGHATFCVVVVYNNVIARLRRTQNSLVEASMDLGADGWQTFRHVTLPSISTALLAGGLLAFALSFDEIVVTNFLAGAQLTLPKWIFQAIQHPRNRPEGNAVAAIVVLLSLLPVYLAQRLAGGAEVAAPQAPREGAGP